jgi:hypothetical protein
VDGTRDLDQIIAPPTAAEHGLCAYARNQPATAVGSRRVAVSIDDLSR